MTNYATAEIRFPVYKRRQVEIEFSGGAIPSNGVILLLREIDRRLA